MELARFAHREHQRHRFGEQSPGDEGQCLRGRPVEPLGVVDQTDQRLLIGGLGQQAEHGQPDEEAVGGGGGAETEGGGEGVTLGRGEPVEVVEHRRAQLVEPGERQLHLRLDACRPGDATRRRARRQHVEQRRLADPGLAPQHQDAALPADDRRDEAAQDVALALAAQQPDISTVTHHVAFTPAMPSTAKR